MRKEITFDEYVHAMTIVRQYEKQTSMVKNNQEYDRINEIKATADKFIDDFECKKQNGRHPRIKYFRFALSHWLREHTKFSLNYIGLLMGGYDHASILHHVREHKRELELKPVHRHELHHEAVQEIEKYFGHLTRSRFGRIEPLPIEQEGSFFISNN